MNDEPVALPASALAVRGTPMRSGSTCAPAETAACRAGRASAPTPRSRARSAPAAPAPARAASTIPSASSTDTCTGTPVRAGRPPPGSGNWVPSPLVIQRASEDTPGDRRVAHAFRICWTSAVLRWGYDRSAGGADDRVLASGRGAVCRVADPAARGRRSRTRRAIGSWHVRERRRAAPGTRAAPVGDQDSRGRRPGRSPPPRRAPTDGAAGKTAWTWRERRKAGWPAVRR